MYSTWILLWLIYVVNYMYNTADFIHNVINDKKIYDIRIYYIFSLILYHI